MSETIKLIQANLQHAKAAFYTISRRFANELLDLPLIQEPWTKGPGRINGLGNVPYKVMFHSSRNKPRACFLVRKGHSFRFPLRRRGGSPTNNPNGGGAAGTGTVCSAYFAGKIEAETTLVKNLFRNCRRNKMHFIVECEANAHT
ncbi:hypothetical protein JTB14_013367 [Gonioctena quinquepunctata]|nr:hypothetical protein JTB14_013367 [Gonioctena quinquepunctata]